MKNITMLIVLTALGLLFASCASDISEPKMSSNPTAPSAVNATLPDSFIVSRADNLIQFSWSAADFGFASSTTYTVQASDSGSFFGHVANLLTTQNMSGGAKISDVNTLVLSWNYSIWKPVTLYYRVVASVSSSVAAVNSSTKSMTLTPYDAVINYPMVYVPGSYQGWSPGDANGRLYSYGFNSQYSSIVRLVDGTTTSAQFKITSNPDWNHTNWGGNLTASGNNYSGTLDPAGGNLQANNACYVIAVDVTALTISLTKTDDWGIIGAAVPPYDWSKSVLMLYNGQRKMWEITADFHAGDFKFRANQDWTLNYGSNASDGTLQAGGSNLTLATAGNYTIRFDPVKLTYTVKKN
jgi:starch-binding outer membrane protein SusE/F